MARTFNGTSNFINCGKGDAWTYSKTLYGRRGDRRYSHPRPFELDNHDILLGYTSNEFQAAFQYRCLTSIDGGLTFPSSTDALIATGAGSIFEGSFTQFPGVNGFLVVVYGDGTTVVRKKSNNRGQTWDAGVIIIDSATVNDPHPDHIRLTNGDLYVVWSDTGDIKWSRSTDGAGDVWSAQAVVVNTANQLLDPSIVELSPNNLLVAYKEQIGASLHNIMVVRSTDNGATWGTPAKARGGTIGSLPSPNLVKLNTGEVLMFFSLNVNRVLDLNIPNNHIRSGHVMVSNDDGATWSYETHFYSGHTHGDIHRIMPIRDSKGQITVDKLWVASTCLDGKREYQIARYDKPEPYPSPSFSNLKRFTSWAWFRYAGVSLNGSGSQYILSKGGTALSPTPERVFLYIVDDGATEINQVRCFVGRSTESTSYWTVNNVFTDGVWTFAAATFDDSRGYDAAGSAVTKARIAFFVGTLPSNIASVAINASGLITEGVGNDILNADHGDLIIGSRVADNLRAFNGDIGPCGVIGRVLTLNEIKGVASRSYPGVPGGMGWELEGIFNPEPYVVAR